MLNRKNKKKKSNQAAGMDQLVECLLSKQKTFKLGVMVHASNPVLRKWRQENEEFKAILCHRLRMGPVWNIPAPIPPAPSQKINK